MNAEELAAIEGAAIRALAEKIATELMTCHTGDVVERLVLTIDGPPRNMGGMNRDCVVGTIERVLRGDK